MVETILSGKYELLAVLGRGGMADVSLAMARGPAGFNKLVVVKELRQELAQDAEHLSMFLSEARLGARLSHPAVVQIYEVVQDRGRLFIAMEYLDGQPLHRVLLKLHDGLPTALHLAIVADALSGLDYAHDLADYDGTPLGVVHRDVSPHNVFVTYDGRVKIMDFGIAKGLDSLLDTKNGVVKGKAAYMAPEQAAGESVDRRADVYSAGVMIWEALTGVRLFRGMHEVTIIGRLLVGDIPSPRTVNADVAPLLEAVCMKALAHDAAARYETAGALRTALLEAMTAANMETSAVAVGRLVSDAFAVERSELKTTIGARLRRRDEAEQRSETSSYPPAMSPASLLGSSRTPTAFGTGTGSLSVGTSSERPPSRTASDAPTVPPPALLRRRRAFASALAAGAATLSLGLAVVLAVTRARDRTRIERSALPPPPVAAAVAPAHVTRPLPLPRGSCGADNKPLVELAGDIEADALLTCDKEYLLEFNVFVRPGVTLRIEPGTVVKGDVDTKAALVVQPGARLVADGTDDRPIVFTSERPEGQRKPGDWGGVILLGNAPTNLLDLHGKPRRGKVEGITSGGDYGGSNEDDDSGVLRNVRIEYAGTELAPGNEINGLTLAGVGRKTVVDRVQVRDVTDDCFEFFGGTVDAKHLACFHGGDDGIDWDLGYRGRLQFLLVEQPPQPSAGANGLEGDNDPNGSHNEPVSAPLVYNATLLGRGAESPGEQYGILVRHRTLGRIANVLVTGFDAGLDVRDEGTLIDLRGTAAFDNGGHAVAYPESAEATGPFFDDDVGFDEAKLFAEPGRGNSSLSVLLGEWRSVRTPAFAPRGKVTAIPVSPPDDGFFDTSARYVGAVREDEQAWTTGRFAVWTD